MRRASDRRRNSLLSVACFDLQEVNSRAPSPLFRSHRASCLSRRGPRGYPSRIVGRLQGFGRFTYESAPPVAADTIFDLASVTKVVATTAVAMLLYEREKLSLDSQSQNFFPISSGWRPSISRRARGVTIRMLLAHSSGLPAYEKLFEFAAISRGTGSRCAHLALGRRPRHARRV